MEGNVSYADVAAMVGRGDCNGNSWNNPMWLLWALMFGNGGYGFNGNRGGLQGAEIMGEINSLREQIADNHNADITNAGIGGVAQAVNAANVGNLLGQKDMAAQIASCCCDIKSNILNQTNQIQSRVDQLANGVTQGFASIGYALSQQTNELKTNETANTQRILDRMCQAETQALRDRLAQASQNEQTAYLISQLKPTT